ncbi:MAG: spondin domain-containing protein [Leptolyngbyaceae cyanobacterium]
MATSTVTVSVKNLAPSDGTRLTPVWVGFHNGQFDTFSAGEPASSALEAIAEDGNITPLSKDFNASGAGRVDGIVSGTPILPNIAASQTFVLDPNAIDSRYFSYAAMILPSNDTFIGNGNPTAIAIFDESGNFVGSSFVVPGSGAYDAGTEINDELPANTAFFGQAAPNTGVDENGLVRLSDGFLPTGSGGILDASEFAAADFTVPGYEFAQITITLDRLVGNDSSETLIGSDTDNLIKGGKGDDILSGLAGDDTLYGGKGQDELLGGDGNDRLLGNRNDDILDGGLGDDRYIGGQGADTFVLRQGEGVDAIRDFKLFQGDTIALAGGLTFDDLTISRFGRNGARLSVDGEELAIVQANRFGAIAESAFTVIE